MKKLRYRKPSLKTVTGITKTKKKVNKTLGITAAKKPARAWGNAKRRVKRKAGYYKTPSKLFRKGMPTPGGCLLPIVTLLLSVLLLILFLIY